MAISGTRYNNGMSNVNSNPCNCEPACTTCGRPWVVCKGDCGCKKSCCNNVNFCEYGKKVSSCFRSVEPSCPMQAVIPSVVVENISGLKHLADCLVHVTNINTTFYIDDKHRTMITWAGPVEYDNYDLDANTLGLRSQFLIDRANDYAAYYNKTGGYQKFNFSEGGESKYTITLDWDRPLPTAQSYAWDVPSPLEIYAPYFLNGVSKREDSFQMAIDGNSVSAADLLAAGDSLINASFAFEVPVVNTRTEPVLTENMATTVKPAVVTNADSALVVSGTYEVDTTNVLGTPQDISLPPLRWKLTVAKNGGKMTFTVESIDILL